MSELSQREVATLPEMQGYTVPDTDLPEITYRLNALIEGLVKLNDLAPFDVEPWPGLFLEDSPHG